MDLATPAFRAGAGLARGLPGPVAVGAAGALGTGAALASRGRRRLVARHLARAQPGLSGLQLQRAVNAAFRSYARYWAESFRLPDVSEEDLDAGLTHEGFEHLLAAREAGRGAIMAVPHLGGWEWAGFWLTRVQGIPITAVVERLDPPELFEWFAGLRRSLGFEVVALGPEAGPACVRALKANHVLCLLCDRDLAGTGPEVEFFGERTTLPGGPATLALRTGAPIMPTAIYFEGRRRHGVVRPPIPVERIGRLRDDVARITQDVAHQLEDLIRAAPDQWHLMQPNWPSDHAGATDASAGGAP
jgi:phosphatidylinositol dimannoside acyltransferase